jgi:hypothetical protein
MPLVVRTRDNAASGVASEVTRVMTDRILVKLVGRSGPSFGLEYPLKSTW